MAIPEFHHSFLMAGGAKMAALAGDGDRRNSLLLVTIAELQQTADFLIEKELMNLVFTGYDV